MDYFNGDDEEEEDEAYEVEEVEEVEPIVAEKPSYAPLEYTAPVSNDSEIAKGLKNLYTNLEDYTPEFVEEPEDEPPEEINLATDPKIVRGLKQLYRTHAHNKYSAAAPSRMQKKQKVVSPSDDEQDEQEEYAEVFDDQQERILNEQYEKDLVNRRMATYFTMLAGKAGIHLIEGMSCSLGIPVQGFAADFDQIEGANATLQEAIESFIPPETLESLQCPRTRLAILIGCLLAKKAGENTCFTMVQQQQMQSVQPCEPDVQQEVQPEVQQPTEETTSQTKPEPDLLKMFRAQGL